VLFLSKIEDIFRITGRGFVVLLGTTEPGIRFKAKDLIQLRTPDGRVLDTHVAAIEFVSGPRVKSNLAFLLPSDVKEQDAPPGTEIWLARDK
jgi:translation elongation factor EF-Tu-like GTPase